MLEWASASDLLDLPGLPKAGPRLKQFLRDVADEHLIHPRTRATGGRPELEYPVWILPEAARTELARRNIEIEAKPSALAAAMLRVESSLEPCGESFTRGSVPVPSSTDSALAGATAPNPLQAAAVPTQTTPQRCAAEGEARPSFSCNPSAAASNSYITLSDSARARADAKSELVTVFAGFRKTAGTALDIAALEFVKAYNSNRLTMITEATRAAMRGRALTVPTLLRWRRESKKEGFARLGGNYGNRKGAGLIDSTPEIRDLIVAMIHDRPHYVESPSRIYDGVKARFNGAAPSRRQVQHFVKAYSDQHRPELLAIANPDAYKSRHRLAIADAGADIIRPNQEWQIDGTPGDVMTSDGRYYVMTVIDVFTRRAKVRISKTATSADAAILVRRAIKAWGVPETIHGDNGKEFIAAHLQRVLMDLGIEYIASTPFSPEQKPFIERFNGSLMHGLFETLPGYIGHNVADRKAIESRKTFAARLGDKSAARFNVELCADYLQIECDKWCDHVYGDRVHSSLAGRSPNQVAAQWIEEGGVVRRIEDERALDLLLGSGEVRVVGKEGIRVSGARFFSVELVPYVGRQVLAIADDDMGRLYVYSQEPRAFVCVAENLDRLGTKRTDMAILAKAAQTRMVTEMRKTTRRMKARIKPELVADEVIARAVADSPEVPTGASVIHETAALLAATAAHEADTAALNPRKPKYDAEKLDEGRAVVSQIRSRSNSAEDDRREDEANRRRFKQLSAETEVSAEDREWMTWFRGTRGYRVLMILENSRGSKIAQVG